MSQLGDGLLAEQTAEREQGWSVFAGSSSDAVHRIHLNSFFCTHINTHHGCTAFSEVLMLTQRNEFLHTVCSTLLYSHYFHTYIEMLHDLYIKERFYNSFKLNVIDKHNNKGISLLLTADKVS